MVTLGKSIRARLTVMSALSSSLALLLACSAFLSYELLGYRRSLVKDLTRSAEVLAFNLTSPLLFEDPGAAKTLLEALRVDSRIRSARLTRANGQAFAVYPQGIEGQSPRIAPLSDPGDGVMLAVPVESDGTRLGTLTLQAGLDEQSVRVRQYLLLTAAVLLASIVAAVGVAAWLQRRISQPIVRLTEAAGLVSRRQDYSVRVEESADGELGILAHAFNTMLSRIEAQSTELKHAVRMRDEFLTIASHELKTPLTPLQLQIQTLMREAQRDRAAGVMRRTELIDRQVHRLAKLVDDLLDLSRLSNRKIDLSVEVLDLSTVVSSIAEQFQSQAQRTGSSLTVVAPYPVVGQWDRARLEQVIVNLISNALKYGAGKPVSVEVLQQGDVGTVIVRDAGIGIGREDLGRIFNRFERAVSERHYGGFGLGLWIVREIVQSMGGTIRVASTLGEGSQFEIELPREPTPTGDSELRGSTPPGAADLDLSSGP